MTAGSARHLRIFISSPGDVANERRRAALVVARLSKEFARFFEIEPVFWEYEVMLAHGHFQDAILPPSRSDVFVAILWSRLGTPLPAGRYRGVDGRVPVTGTEWEFEDALQGKRARGVPDLLVFKRTGPGEVRFDDESELLSAADQKRALNTFWTRYFEGGGEFKAAFKEYAELDEFETLLEENLRKYLRGKLGGDVSSDWSHTPIITWHEGSPFRGLYAFEEKHAKIFFGRGQAQKQIVEQLVRCAKAGHAFMLVLGASGVGKSSLVAAGVIPDLVTPGVVEGVDVWRRVVYRPRDGEGDLFVGFADALTRRREALPELKAAGVEAEALGQQLRDLPAGLALPIGMALRAVADAERTRLAKPKPQARLIVVVDQLEELFTLEWVRAEHRSAFAAMLAALARTGLVWVVATMRSDFYHRLADIPVLVDLSRGDGGAGGEYHLAQPSLAEIQQMVRLPAAAAGIHYGTDDDRGIGLDAELCQALQSNTGALPLLEFVLDELYRLDIEEGRGQTLTFGSYERLGGLEGAIAHRAEKVCELYPDDVVAAVLGGLVTLREEDETGTARTVRRDELGSNENRRQLIEALDRGRLLVSAKDKRGRPTVRLAHEALITRWRRLATVIATNREFLRIRVRLERAASDWANDDERTDRLLADGIALAEGREALSRREGELPPVVARFIMASVAESTRRSEAVAAEHRRRIAEKADAERAIIEERARADREILQGRLVVAQRLRRRTLVFLGGIAIALVISLGFGWSWLKSRNMYRQHLKSAEALIHTIVGDLQSQLEAIGNLDLLDTALGAVMSYFAKTPPDCTEAGLCDERAVALGMLGDVLRQRQQPAQALERYREGARLLEVQAARRRETALQLRSRVLFYERSGSVLEEQGELSRALAAYGKGLVSVEKFVARGEAAVAFAEACITIGEVRQALQSGVCSVLAGGQFKKNKAVGACRVSMRRIDELLKCYGVDREQVVSDYAFIGRRFEELGMYRDAHDSYVRALAVAERVAADEKAVSSDITRVGRGRRFVEELSEMIRQTESKGRDQ